MSNVTLKAKSRVGKVESAREGIDSISKGSIIAMGIVSSLIGVWAISCLVGAMLTSGGPIALFESWFKAIGM